MWQLNTALTSLRGHQKLREHPQGIQLSVVVLMQLWNHRKVRVQAHRARYLLILKSKCYCKLQVGRCRTWQLLAALTLQGNHQKLCVEASRTPHPLSVPVLQEGGHRLRQGVQHFFAPTAPLCLIFHTNYPNICGSMITPMNGLIPATNAISPST